MTCPRNNFGWRTRLAMPGYCAAYLKPSPPSGTRQQFSGGHALPISNESFAPHLHPLPAITTRIHLTMFKAPPSTQIPPPLPGLRACPQAQAWLTQTPVGGALLTSPPAALSPPANGGWFLAAASSFRAASLRGRISCSTCVRMDRTCQGEGAGGACR